MFKRLWDWNQRRRRWNEEHEQAWAPVREPGESGLSTFQERFEPAVRAALAEEGLDLVDREVLGSEERYVTALVADTGLRLYVYRDGAELLAESSTAVGVVPSDVELELR